MARRPDQAPDLNRDRVDRGPLHADTTGTASTHKPKTSAAAAFALVFGLSALFCALTVILGPLGIVFGLIGLILGIVGIKKSKDWHVTGKGVAVGGLIMSVLGLLLGITILVGAATFLTNDQNLQRIETRLQDLRGEIPTTVPTP